MTVERVVIHGGMHKTGSSFVQNTLFENRTALEQAGVLYAATGLHHRSPAAGIRHLGLRMSLRSEGAASFALDRLRNELNQSSCHTAVISYEGIYGPDLDLRMLTDGLAAYDPTLVVFLRNPVDYVESKYREWVRLNSFSGDTDDFFVEHGGYVDYATLADTAVSILGADRVAMQAIELIEERGNLATTTLELGGVDTTGLELTPTTVDNPSAGNSYILTKLMANKMFLAGDVDVRVACERFVFEYEHAEGRITSDELVDRLRGAPTTSFNETVKRFGGDPTSIESKWANRTRDEGFDDERLRSDVVDHLRQASKDKQRAKKLKQRDRKVQAEQIAADKRDLADALIALEAERDTIDAMRRHQAAEAEASLRLATEYDHTRQALADARERHHTTRARLRELEEHQAEGPLTSLLRRTPLRRRSDSR